jgi:hypothetical protein
MSSHPVHTPARSPVSTGLVARLTDYVSAAHSSRPQSESRPPLLQNHADPRPRRGAGPAHYKSSFPNGGSLPGGGVC